MEILQVFFLIALVFIISNSSFSHENQGSSNNIQNPKFYNTQHVENPEENIDHISNEIIINISREADIPHISNTDYEDAFIEQNENQHYHLDFVMILNQVIVDVFFFIIVLNLSINYL